MMFLLNLPSPSDDLLNAIQYVVDMSPVDNNLKAEMDNVQKYQVNSISHTYELDDKVQELTNIEFQKFFPDEVFIPSVGVLRNHFPNERIASFPPHADRKRIFCLNYYIQEGGKHVTTVIYDKLHNFDEGIGTGKMYRYDELAVESIHHCKMNSWYAMQVRQVHSVENIENIRIIYTLSFHYITMRDFMKKYADYVKM